MSEAIYIGRKLKEARVRRLLTQEELAEKAGVSPHHRQHRTRSDSAAFPHDPKLAQALDVDPTSLLGQ